MRVGRFFGLAPVLSVALLALAAHALYPRAPTIDHVSFQPPVSTGGAGAYAPPILGAATHFGSMRPLGYTDGPRASRQVEQLGANSYRDGIPWISFSFADLGNPQMWQRRRIMDFLPIADARPLIVLGATNARLADSGMPFSDRQLAEFAAYTRSVVRLTQRYGAIYEVWNEYNLGVQAPAPKQRLAGEGDPSDIRAAIHYAVLARIAVKAVKDANPSSKVVVGAVGEDPGWSWTQAIVREGALDGADGLSVHLYNQCSRPEMRNAAELLTRLTQLQELLRKQRGGRDTPIYVSEFGWPTDGRCNISPERAGYNFAHYILQSAALRWLRGSWIYELKDEGTDRSDMEQNFGVFTYDDKPKPAACFVREARAIVAAARSVELKQPRPDVFILRAVLPDRQIAAVWSNAMAPAGRLRLAGQPKSVRFMCGRTVAANGEIPVSQAPLLAEYGLGQPVSITVSG